MNKKSFLALYKDPEKAADGLTSLAEANFEKHTFDVLTGTPYPEGAFGEHVPQHRLFRFPLIGAAIGFTFALLLTVGTQIAYPLVTGGKPILSIFAMIVIIYELTMLIAVISTVIAIVFESRLPNYTNTLYDPRITEGLIGVTLNTTEERSEEAMKILKDSGALEIKTN